jgi:hypothetical protein
MKVQRKVGPTTILEAEGATVAEVFEALARLEEVFHGYEVCGACQGKDVSYQVREDKQGNKYYQAHCHGCGCEFRFGVKRQPPGCLFPQLKDNNGNWKENGGWVKWNRNEDNKPQAAPKSDEEYGRDVPF